MYIMGLKYHYFMGLIYKYMDKMYECTDVRMSGYMNIWIRYMGIWIYGYMNI